MKYKTRYQAKTDLKLLREIYHLSKEEVASYINYSTRTLERIEKENAATTEHTARQLCELYHINYEDAFYERNDHDISVKRLRQFGKPTQNKIDHTDDYYLVYVRKIGDFSDYIAGKVMWTGYYGRNKEKRVLRPLKKEFVSKDHNIPIINSYDEWTYWYFGLIIGKIYPIVIAKKCMHQFLNSCLDEIIVSPKDLMIYKGTLDIAFLRKKEINYNQFLIYISNCKLLSHPPSFCYDSNN